ncbi:MAG TPA: benenodin family lasso peptide [Sphingomonas sp.]|nr:benenodin family lasso peptide [Sphingomonas sp.]
MNRHDSSEPLIDLGAASVETQGRPELGVDLFVQGIPATMSDED